MLDAILGFFGTIVKFFYTIGGNNYLVALILFAVLVKVLMLPLSIKQQKNSIKQANLRPKEMAIRKRYAGRNDQPTQQKMQQDILDLYQKENFNPMGGCLPLLIQLPILFGLYRVIYKPITFMLHRGDEIASLTEQFMANSELVEKYGDITARATQQAEIILAKAFGLINFDFLGLDISATPSITNPSLIWIVPILATVTTYLTSKITSAMGNIKKEKDKNEEQKPQRVLSPEQKSNTGSTSSAESMTKSMSIMMPIMTLWITFTLPATIGVYWTISNLASLLQTVFLNGYYKNKMQVEVAEKSELIAQQKADKRARYNHKKR